MDTAENDAPTHETVMTYLGKATYETQRFEHYLGALYPMLVIHKGDRTQFQGRAESLSYDRL